MYGEWLEWLKYIERLEELIHEVNLGWWITKVVINQGNVIEIFLLKYLQSYSQNRVAFVMSERY